MQVEEVLVAARGRVLPRLCFAFDPAHIEWTFVVVLHHAIKYRTIFRLGHQDLVVLRII